MIELQKLYFDSELQLKLFFVVLNKPKGITRDNIRKQTQIPRTTIYDNLTKLTNKTILVGPELNIEMPYVKTYRIKLTSGKGRTSVLFFVPKLLRNTFMKLYLPDIIVLGDENF